MKPNQLRALLAAAQGAAQTGQFRDCHAICQQAIATSGDDAEALLSIGVLLSGAGFPSTALECFERSRALRPADHRPLVNIANASRDTGDHQRCRELYEMVLARTPDDPLVRRNALVSLEYDAQAGESLRFERAREWGTWAVARAGGPRSRPNMRPPAGRPLKVGYVSADFCQHTVGLFTKAVLAAHDRDRVIPYAYSAGAVNDWVTAAVREACVFRDVAQDDDRALVSRISQDGIDILVDLSGHTAGSRLTAFAHRPAPVQVSWLGYFATTGLDAIDAVLLDEWHAPDGTEAQFVESVIRMPSGRLCYEPVPWAPASVGPLAADHNGFITFGSFNNTAKLNAGVFDLWARILAGVPGSRLVLKWRTFNDDGMRTSVHDAFRARGIDPGRIDLRGPSFHEDVLKEYGDIDIALDPFPFTGGLTSCEALWMGVPVVTFPQGRVVSRQTFAVLSEIGLAADLSARDADDYIRIAVTLASEPIRLRELRAGLRDRMKASRLMDVPGFTRGLENSLAELYENIHAREGQRQAIGSTRTVLHVGPGHRRNGAKLPAFFDGWRELRLDIDPANEPDIVGSMLDMQAVADASVDAIYSAHNIEHVYPHEVPVVLGEFMRVLKADGFLFVTCPDLQTVCELVAQDKLTEPAYVSPAGPISPLDILYGHGAAVAAGHASMAHKGGFTLRSLSDSLRAAGFVSIAGKRRLRGFDLFVVATKRQVREDELTQLAASLMPA